MTEVGDIGDDHLRREGGREGEREGEREGGREGEREGEREGGREGGRVQNKNLTYENHMHGTRTYAHTYVYVCSVYINTYKSSHSNFEIVNYSLT